MSEKINYIPTPASPAEILQATRETLQDLKNMVIAQIVSEGYVEKEEATDFVEGKTFEQLDAIQQALENGKNPIEHFSDYLK